MFSMFRKDSQAMVTAGDCEVRGYVQVKTEQHKCIDNSTTVLVSVKTLKLKSS